VHAQTHPLCRHCNPVAELPAALGLLPALQELCVGPNQEQSARRLFAGREEVLNVMRMLAPAGLQAVDPVTGQVTGPAQPGMLGYEERAGGADLDGLLEFIEGGDGAAGGGGEAGGKGKGKGDKKKNKKNKKKK
jgi:hypothetical protein